MKLHTFRYTIPDYDEVCPEDAREFESRWDKGSLEYVAEDAAQNYFDNYGGYDSHWPLVFRLWGEGNLNLGDFEVELEMIPRFTAMRVKNDK